VFLSTRGKLRKNLRRVWPTASPPSCFAVQRCSGMPPCAGNKMRVPVVRRNLRPFSCCRQSSPTFLAPSEPMTIIYNSGTSGISKGVVLTIGNVGHMLDWHLRPAGLVDGGRSRRI